MGYLNELLSRNPLVIDGGTIRPHHKYTDDLYMGSENKMTNYDRIKSMSVEEMAELLCQISTNTIKTEKIIEVCHTLVEIEKERLKKWLLQEVSEDDRAREID